ncbi:MAG TPA: phosphatase PAP2 family protein, partial [Saccharofermentans sp.]|nr:phosphatase PAP2 family protein [Saccharofermentans sp.]
MELIQELDWSILNWIAEHMHNGVLDVVMISFTAIGEIGLVWILLSLWKILSKDLRKRKEGILMIVAILVGVLIANVILKNTVCRSRPCWLNETVDLLIKNP